MDYWILILSALLGGIILYIYRAMTYFKRHGVPHETPIPILGNLLQVMLRREHMVTYVNEYSNRFAHAKYAGIYMFKKPVILIRDSELVKEITIKHFEHFHDHDTFVSEDTDPLFGKGLFAMKGSRWKETRAILSPAFTANKMRQMFELMTNCAYNLSQHIYENAKRGDVDIDIKDACSKYTVDVIASCAFGISINSLENPTNKFYVLGKKALKVGVWQNIKLLIANALPFVAKLLKLQIFDAELTQFFNGLVKDTIETRKREGIVRPDMIQLMLESKEKNGSLQLDITDMTAQAFLFFLGGFETSSSLAAFTAIELSRNPKIQERLLEEIDEAMDKCNGKPTYEIINSLPYLEAILYETLRYFPIAGVMDRICVRDFELPPALPGLKSYTIKKGEVIWIASHAIHSDPQNYENPHEFNPDRFYNQKMNINMPAYLGFGIGPRSCIGNRFALLENKLVLFYLLTKCKIEVSSKLKQPIKFVKNSFIVLIEGGFWIKIVPRK